MYARFIKRIIDFIVALIGIIVLSPLLILLSILIRINLGSPVLFYQRRTTKNNRPFNIIKFRTMTDKRDENNNLLPDEQRQTKLGLFLRSSSLDELPELFNILKGDMAIIGPRPLLESVHPYYKKSELDRFKVLGGLIPPDSVDDNPIISWDKQFEYEAEYAKNVSFINDVKIFIAAFKIIIKRNSSDYGGFSRMPLNQERKKRI